MYTRSPRPRPGRVAPGAATAAAPRCACRCGSPQWACDRTACRRTGNGCRRSTGTVRRRPAALGWAAAARHRSDRAGVAPARPAVGSGTRAHRGDAAVPPDTGHQPFGGAERTRGPVRQLLDIRPDRLALLRAIHHHALAVRREIVKVKFGQRATWDRVRLSGPGGSMRASLCQLGPAWTSAHLPSRDMPASEPSPSLTGACPSLRRM